MSGLLRKVALVGSLTAVSRVGGVVREQLMAYAFGTGLAKSAFNVAFQIPNLFRRLFGEGALSSAFVPVFAETLSREGREQAGRLASRAAGLLVAALGAAAAAGILLALALERWWFEPGSRWAAILPLLRIMLPYAPLICLAALVMGALNALRHFAMPALAPVFLNLVMIGALLGVCPLLADDPRVRIEAVAWAVLAAGAVQVAVQLPALARRGLRLRLRFDWRGDPRIRRVLLLMAPMALGAGAFQVNVVIDGFLAMWAAPWAPAAIQYADLIVYLPLGLVGNAFGTVLLPTFSHQAAQGDREGLRTTLEGALRHVLLIMAPAVVALTVLALPIVEAIYVWPRGKFGDQDAIWTMRALAGLAPGLLFFGAQKTLTPAFYALQDARTPLRIALWGVGLNLVLNVLFVLTWPPGWKHVGLVVSTVIASAVNTVALASELRRRAGAPQWAALAPAARAAATAMLGMGLAAWASHAWLREALAPLHPAKLAQVAALAGAGVVSAVVYLLIVRVLCPQDLKDIVRDFLHRPGGKA